MFKHAFTSSRGRRVGSLLAALVALAVAPGASALTHGQSPTGWAFVDGGIGQTETDDMQAERTRYSLWVSTAGKTSGAFLADVEVIITDDKGERVFERKLEGPWLMIDLPLGRYEVQARNGQEVQRRVTTIHPADHHQIVFHFDVEAEVLPKP